MPDLKEFQEQHNQFIEEMGWRGNKTPLEAVALIHEEAAELGHELRSHKVNEHLVALEMADIVIRTMDLASEMGIDLEEASQKKLDYNAANIVRLKAKGRRV